VPLTFGQATIILLDTGLINATVLQAAQVRQRTLRRSAQLPYPMPLSPSMRQVVLEASHPSGGTDTNLVWEAQAWVYYGLVAANLTTVATGIEYIFNASVIATGGGDGVKPDSSFWMHGAQLYSGGYGEGYIVGMLNVRRGEGGTR